MRLGHSITRHIMIWDIFEGQYAIWDIQRLGPKVEVRIPVSPILSFIKHPDASKR
jgi:hypothetical protein